MSGTGLSTLRVSALIKPTVHSFHWKKYFFVPCQHDTDNSAPCKQLNNNVQSYTEPYTNIHTWGDLVHIVFTHYRTHICTNFYEETDMHNAQGRTCTKNEKEFCYKVCTECSAFLLSIRQWVHILVDKLVMEGTEIDKKMPSLCVIARCFSIRRKCCASARPHLLYKQSILQCRIYANQRANYLYFHIKIDYCGILCGWVKWKLFFVLYISIICIIFLHNLHFI